MARHEITHCVTLDTADLVEMLQLKGHEPTLSASVCRVQGSDGVTAYSFAAPKDFQVTICWTEVTDVKD